jgi:hypothetical protein
MEWPDPADKAHAVEQVKRLRNQAAAGGLKFEAYVPPDLAVWLLDRIEQGNFVDPSEATFVLLGEARDLNPTSIYARSFGKSHSGSDRRSSTNCRG